MSEGPGAGLVSWLRADLRRFDLAVATTTVALGTLLLLGSPDEYDTGWPEVVAGVGAFVLVLFRRSRPLLLLAIAIAWTGVHVFVWERPSPTGFAGLVLLATASVRLERWSAIALGAVMAISLYVSGLIVNDAEIGDSRAVIGIAWTAGAVGIGDAARSWRRYRESAEQQVRAALLATEAETRQQVSEERLTIARELHDLLAHNLSVMNVQTGAALHLLRSDPDQAEQSLTEAREAGRSVLDELRELLSVLRDDDAEAAPTSSLPTIERLPDLIDTMRSAGLDITWSNTGADRTMAPAVSLAAYRIVQEALTNAAKHGSGSAEVTTDWDDRGMSIEITNQVASGAGEGSGHGVIGMRERAVANGGRFDRSVVDGRHIVEAWLPASPIQGTTT